MLKNINSERSGYIWLHYIFDLLAPIVVLAQILYFYSLPLRDRYILLGVLGGLLFMVTNQFIGTYDNRRSRSFFINIQKVFNGWFIAWILLVVIAFLSKRSAEYSRAVTLIWAVLTFIVLIGYRLILWLLLHYYLKKTDKSRSIAVLGVGNIGQYLSSIIQKNPFLGYQVIGYYDDNPESGKDFINGLPILGNSEKALADAESGKFQELYLCMPLGSEEKIKCYLNRLTNSSVIVKIIPDFFTFDLMRTKWVELNGVPIISIYDTPLNSVTARFIKRTEDIVLSFFILLLIWPLMLFISVIIKITSPGPVFYTQTRVGWNGNTFEIIKFRSMPVNIEEDGIIWGNAKNKTINMFGQFIRSHSLDELPQFINVLKGEMSIVGPRPERDVFVEKFRKDIPGYMQKHMVKGGITGWAQINGWRGETSLNKRIEYDLHYINNWSFWLDIKIIFMSLFYFWKDDNAC